jgi:dihydrofolate reductase
MSIAIVAAMSQNRVIGRDEEMPWDVPDGFCCFLRCIDDQTVIVGRKTWESMGKHFTSSQNIVVTSGPAIPGVEVAPTFAAAIEQARRHGRRIFIAGGGSIFRQALEAGVVDEIYLTVIRREVEGDTWFPELDESAWNLIQRKQHPDYLYLHYRVANRDVELTGGQTTEGGGQRTDDRGRRTEDGGRRADDGGRRISPLIRRSVICRRSSDL